MDDQHWTPARVEARLTDAADVLQRLPDARAQGYFNTWPDFMRSFGDMVGQAPEPMRRPPPSPASITNMEQTLAWVRLVAPEDGKLIWARSEGAPWKAICWRFGISRATAHRRWRYGLTVIALRLNGKRVLHSRRRRRETLKQA